MLAAEAGLPVRDAFPLGPLSRDLLPLVVRGPAQRAGIAVDDELVARIVADTGGGRRCRCWRSRWPSSRTESAEAENCPLTATKS